MKEWEVVSSKETIVWYNTFFLNPFSNMLVNCYVRLQWFQLKVKHETTPSHSMFQQNIKKHIFLCVCEIKNNFKCKLAFLEKKIQTQFKTNISKQLKPNNLNTLCVIIRIFCAFNFVKRLRKHCIRDINGNVYLDSYKRSTPNVTVIRSLGSGKKYVTSKLSSTILII